MYAKFSLEFKLKAIAMSKVRGSISVVADQLNITKDQIMKWRSLYCKGQLTGKKGRLKGPKELKINQIKSEINKLKKETAKIRVEIEILKKGCPYLSLPPQKKYLFIRENKAVYPIAIMCRVLNVGPVGYYRWLIRPPSKETEYNAILLKEIKRIFTEHKRRYGSHRIAKELQVTGFQTSQPSVLILMRKAGLKTVWRK